MSESFKLFDPVETLSSELTGKTDIEKKHYLIVAFSLDSIDTTSEKHGYWLLYQNGKSAIFSLKNNSLIKIPHAPNDSEYFGSITSIGSTHQGDNDEKPVYISVGGEVGARDIANIEYIGVIHGNNLEIIHEIPKGSSLSTARLLIQMQDQVRLLQNSADDFSTMDVEPSQQIRTLH